MPSTVASAALYYAERRLPVFPVAPRAKRPRTAHGLKDATTDAAQITEWWRKSPDANIGAATGRASDLAVIDLDGPEGEASFAALEGPVEDMPVVLTGRGAHLHFRAPPFELRNSAGKIGPGVDIRADGGYVLLPPSVHPSGTVYQWIGKPRARPPWPEWLLCPAPTRPEPSPTVRGPRYAIAALERETAAVRAAPEGTRNDQLNRSAYKLARFITSGDLRAADVVAALLASSALPEVEARRTIASALKSRAA